MLALVGACLQRACIVVFQTLQAGQPGAVCYMHAMACQDKAACTCQ